MSKYTQENLEVMRIKLAEDDSENIDGQALFEICLDGCPGWKNLSDEDVIEYFEDNYGDDYFEVHEISDRFQRHEDDEVQDEKDHKNGLYGEEI